MKSNLEKIRELDEKTLKTLYEKRKKLENQERNVYELEDFAKKSYLSSIPVMMLFTAFIDLIYTSGFSIQEYLLLNGITIPFVVLVNTFVCGTSKSRKRKLIMIGDEIQNTDNEIYTLSRRVTESKKLVNSKLQDNVGTYQIKPIERKCETKSGNKTLVKKIAKK